MSCMVLSYESTAKLAHFITSLCEHGFDYFGFSAPETLHKAFNDCRSNPVKAFEKLVRYNYLAYDGRYSNSERTIFPDMPTVECPYHPRNFKSVDGNADFKEYYTVIEPWHYQLYKTLQCYTYQIAEDATIDSDLYKALTELEKTIATFIVANQPDYVTAKWG